MSTSVKPYSIRDLPEIYDRGFLKTEHQNIQRAISSIIPGVGILDPTVSHGADNTGTKDATSALMKAAAALKANQVFRPVGTFKVNGEILFRTSNAYWDHRHATFNQVGSNNSTLRWEAVSHVLVVGGHLVGKGTEHTGHGGSTSWNGVAAMRFDGDCTNVNIHDVTALNHAGGGIRWGLGTMQSMRVHGCYVKGVGLAGGIVAGDNNGDVGIGSYTSTADNDILLWGNEILESCFGIFIARGTGAYLDNVVRLIRGQHGYYISQMSDVDLRGQVRDCALIGAKNQIAGDNLTATDIRIGPLIATRCQTGVDVSVTSVSNNSWYDRVKMTAVTSTECTTSYGIATDRVKRLELDACTVDGGSAATMAYAYYLTNSAYKMRNCTARNASWNGVFGSLVNHSEIKDCNFADVCLNTGAAADDNRYRYLIHVTTGSAYALVANPEMKISGGSFDAFTNAEPTFFAGAQGFVVRFADGVKGYVWNVKNFTSKGYLSSTASDLQMMEIIGRVLPTYGANIAINRSLGNFFDVIATNGTAFNMNAPTNSTPGVFGIRVKNSSGGALGVLTWNAIYHRNGAWTQPANGFSRLIWFYYDGTVALEITPLADIAN